MSPAASPAASRSGQPNLVRWMVALPSAPAVVVVVVVMVVALASGLLSVVGTPPAGASPPAGSGRVPPPEAPLTTTWTTAQGSWAVLPMGELRRPLDTFWEMLFRPAGGSDWSLVTPTGVADNGGLVADDAQATTVTAGFLPSQTLRFSPLAQTTTDGKEWSPGVLPAALIPAPDAVAAGSGGTVDALVETAHGELLASDGSLSSWKTLITLRSLAETRAGRACGLGELRAASIVTTATGRGGSGVPELGGSCAKPGVVGVFTDEAGSWKLSGPRLPGPSSHEKTGVLRLQSGPSGTAALVEAGRGSAARLFAIWRAGPSATWALSPPLAVRGGVVATGFGPAGSMVVVTGGGKGNHGKGAKGADAATSAESVTGPGMPWVALPSPPKGTASVSAGPSGTFDALAVDSRELVDWRLDTTTHSWTRLQKLHVPLAYGSST